MICPNIHIKEVKDGFNEMVEAFGGEPLTDEEFKSSELRNQRTGQNYAAMELAYRCYHRNNGNMLDKAPNGNDSVLFNSLLEYFNGDRKAAIKAKSNVYSDEFFNWFGDWTLEDKENVSKVVDENGEPKVVYRGVNDSNYGKIYAYYTDNKEEAYVYARGQFTKGGKFYSNNKEFSGAARELLYKKFNVSSVDIDYLYNIIDDFSHDGEYINGEIDSFETFVDEDGIEHTRLNTHYEQYKSKRTQELYELAIKDIDILQNDPVAKDLLDIIYLSASTALTTEQDLFRLYDDPTYFDDVGKLNSLISKYHSELDPLINEYKPTIDVVVLNIRNPYKGEIQDEDLLNNSLAYTFGHDGAFLMNGEHFLIKSNSGQARDIKTLKEDVVEINDQDANIYHNLSPDVPEVIPPFPTEGNLGELHEKEFVLLLLWKLLLDLFDEIQLQINDILGPDELSKLKVSINGEDIIFSERKNKLLYVGNGKNIFGLVSVTFKIIDDNVIHSSLLFPDRHIFDKDFNYNRINNSIKNNTVRLIYELLSVLKDNGQTLVYSPWYTASSGKYTGVLENASVLINRMSELFGIDCSEFVTSEEKLVLTNSPFGEYYRTDFRVVFNIDSMLKKLPMVGHVLEIYDVFNQMYNRPQEKINNQLIIKGLLTKQEDLKQKQEELLSIIKEVQKEIKVEKDRIHNEQIDQMLNEVRGQNKDFLYEDLPFNITLQSLIYAVLTKINSGMSKSDIKSLIDSINYNYGSSLKYNGKTNSVYGKKLSDAKDDIRRTTDKNIQKIESIVEYLNNKFGNKILVLYIDEDDWLRDGRLFDGSNSCIINDIVYLRKSRMTTEIAAEEMLHVLVHAMKNGTGELGNILLFNNLFLKAKERFPRLWEEIQLAYKYNLEEELVTLVLARYLNKDFDKRDKYKINDLVNKFKNWVIQIFKDVLHEFGGRKYLELNNLNPLLDFQDISDIILAKDLYFSILTFSEIHGGNISNSLNTRHNLNNQPAQSIDQIRKSAEDIRHRFGVLYKAYQKMPNKSASRQKLANEIFEVYNEIKRLDNFEAVTNALEFARKKLGLTDDSSTRGVLQWLQDNESDNFAKVSAEQIVDVMQNSIGFFENLLTYFPSDCYMTEEARLSRAVVTDGIRNKIRPLWVKAVYTIGDRIVDELVDRWFTGQDEDRAGMKEVAKDWLHKNAMYSDISNIAAFLLNYQYSENPITKLVFHLIQVADTKTGIELLPIAAKVTKAYRKANKGKLSPSWLKIFMEFDKDGIPTGNFVRDINYGQYQKDVDEFITNLNKEFQDKYGHSYYIDEDGTYINSLTGGFGDDEVWSGNIPPHIIEYKLAIEEFKCGRANRRYTFEYYKERMSEPYTGPDPLLTKTTGEFKHGLSPRTLSRYERIQSNINYYMSLCYNKEDGKSHPEDLSPEDWIKLELWRQYLDDLSNPYNEDGSTKTGEDYQTAIEIRAWEKWIGLKLDTQVDMKSFEAEALKILAEKGPIAYDKFIKYNSRVGINPNLISQTIKQFGVTDMYADAVHARLLRTSLLRLVNSKHGYGRELGKQAKNPQFWQECRRTDQLIEDCKTKRGRDFAEMMEKTFANDLIEYRDAYGNAYDYFGRVVPRDQEKTTNLLTWYDYMVNSYVSEIMSSPTRTIEGLYDGSGNLIVFSGSEADVKAAVKQFFTYRRSRTLADGTVKIERVPLSIFSLLTPLQDTFVNQNTGKTEKSITNIPSGRFSNKVDQTGKYLTDPTVFDNSSHIAELPKREYYDNSDAFNAMSDDERALYDILVETCANTLKLYRQNSAHFNWRLPMVNAQSMALLSRLKSDGFAKVSRAIFDSITTVEENDENVRTAEQFATNPDGTIATDVPLKFVHPLKDMSRLSTDVASMVILFAEMGLNYKNKLEIDDKIKALRYNLNFDVRNEMELDEDEVSPNEGKNSVLQFDNMTNIHMYGNDWHFKADKDEPYEKHIIAAQKATRWLQRYETTHMLGLNILSMLVGACDAFVKLFREVLNGKYARPQDMVKGLVRCIEHTPMVIKNINNPLANNKLTALMLMFRISKGTRATYEHMNWGRLKKLGALFLMGGFSMLDYMMNGLLLMTHMSNVRLYEGDSQVPKGFYTLYELQQLFVKTGRTKFEATLKHLMLHEDLYNAFEFISGEGTCVIKPEYQPYITDDTLTMIRTKTLSRGALYNGMNPDNDQPQARKKVWSAMALSMRGWLTQAYQHLMSGGTDNIVINRDKIEDTTTRYGITKKSVLYKKRSITNEERSRRQAWNYETGTPQDQIFVGLYRGFGTLYKYIVTNAFRNIPEGDPRKVKFSDVEKYAAKDAIIYLAILGLMLATWPIVNSTAAAAPPPDKNDPKLLDNPYDYIMDVYIPNQYWKLQAADIYFRTIESSISSVDPTTALDFITSLTVLKSGFDEQLGLIKIAGDLTGLSGHDISEILKRGGYKYYTRGQRALAKGFGFPDNIHTAFDYFGLYSNMDFYLSKYGGIYKFWGYDWREEWKKDKKPKNHIEGGPQAGPKKSKKGNFGPGPRKKKKKNNSGMVF